jgi:hypothetical protein
MNATVKQMVEEIRTELSNGAELEAIKDRSHEFIDSYLPIYTNEIIKEWQEMPSEYDDRGVAEMGHNCEEVSITNLMTSDLYLYYTDLFFEAVGEVENLLEVAE